MTSREVVKVETRERRGGGGEGEEGESMSAKVGDVFREKLGEKKTEGTPESPGDENATAEVIGGVAGDSGDKGGGGGAIIRSLLSLAAPVSSVTLSTNFSALPPTLSMKASTDSIDNPTK